MDWKASCEMKPESWEETEERRAGVCCGSTEDDDEARKRKWEVGEWQWEPLERESLLLTLFRLLLGHTGRGQRSVLSARSTSSLKKNLFDVFGLLLLS